MLKNLEIMFDWNDHQAKCTSPDLFSPILLVNVKGRVAIHTVWESKCLHPLIVVLTPLSSELCNSDISSKIHLKPLVCIISPSWPGACFSICSRVIESSVRWTVIFLECGGCRHLLECNETTFQPKCCFSCTCFSWKKKKNEKGRKIVIFIY